MSTQLPINSSPKGEKLDANSPEPMGSKVGSASAKLMQLRSGYGLLPKAVHVAPKPACTPAVVSYDQRLDAILAFQDIRLRRPLYR